MADGWKLNLCTLCTSDKVIANSRWSIWRQHKINTNSNTKKYQIKLITLLKLNKNDQKENRSDDYAVHISSQMLLRFYLRN